MFSLGGGDVTSETIVLLPLAGADIVDWLEATVRSFPSWVATWLASANAAAIEKAELECVSMPWFQEPVRRRLRENCIKSKKREALLVAWMTVAGKFLDFQIEPVDDTFTAPCSFYAEIPPSSLYGFVTLAGRVVHGSKVANLLYGVFGRLLGYTLTELQLGAHVNQAYQFIRLNSTRLFDDPSSQSAVELGTAIIDSGVATGAVSISTVLNITSAAALQTSQFEKQGLLWPSPKKAHLPNSHFTCNAIPDRATLDHNNLELVHGPNAEFIENSNCAGE